MSKKPNGAAMLLRQTPELEKIQADIHLPDFYDKIGSYIGFEIRQGQFLFELASYRRDDQFICAVDGTADIYMVPHVYR
jgi:hypothetical protein